MADRLDTLLREVKRGELNLNTDARQEEKELRMKKLQKEGGLVGQYATTDEQWGGYRPAAGRETAGVSQGTQYVDSLGGRGYFKRAAESNVDRSRPPIWDDALTFGQLHSPGGRYATRGGRNVGVGAGDFLEESLGDDGAEREGFARDAIDGILRKKEGRFKGMTVEQIQQMAQGMNPVKGTWILYSVVHQGILNFVIFSMAETVMLSP